MIKVLTKTKQSWLDRLKTHGGFDDIMASVEPDGNSVVDGFVLDMVCLVGLGSLLAN